MHHQLYIDEAVVVDESTLVPAMRHLMDRMKLVVEAERPITVAALMSGVVKANGKTVAVLSGGNIEWGGLRELLG
jgi:threonine dehydratase